MWVERIVETKITMNGEWLSILTNRRTPMPTQHAQDALQYLRDPSLFQWHVIPMLAVVIYIYTLEIEKRNWNTVLAGLALMGMDWFNEVWNSLLFHFNQYAPAWGTPGGNSAYQIFIGFNIEIQFFFAFAGIAACKTLPADPRLKVLGMPNRLAFAIGNSLLCVCVEMILNQIGVLTWDLSWWNREFPLFIFLLGYFPFFVVAFWVHDMKHRRQQVLTVGGILTLDIVCFILFGGILGWI